MIIACVEPWGRMPRGSSAFRWFAMPMCVCQSMFGSCSCCHIGRVVLSRPRFLFPLHPWPDSRRIQRAWFTSLFTACAAFRALSGAAGMRAIETLGVNFKTGI